MARKRQIRICREGIYYLIVVLAVLVGATARQLNLLMLLGAMLAGPMLFSLVFGRLVLSRATVRRVLPSQLRADQRLVVDLSITNRRRWLSLTSIEVQDHVVREDPAGMDGETMRVSVFYPRVCPRETKRTTYYGQLPQRGKYRFGPLRVSSRFPFGLVRHALVLSEPATMIVHPKVGQLAREWGQLVRENATGSQRLRRGLLEADFYGLRDWRAGDNRRWIHWRTSARRGALVVRQFEQRRSQDLAILVDLWQPLHPSPQQREHVEQAISFVATLIAEACRHAGRKITLDMAAAVPLHRAGPATALFLKEQLDALALIAPHGDESIADALLHSLARVGLNVPTLLVSTREVDWDALEQAAGRLKIALAGRKLRTIDVASAELSRFFHASA